MNVRQKDRERKEGERAGSVRGGEGRTWQFMDGLLEGKPVFQRKINRRHTRRGGRWSQESYKGLRCATGFTC